MGYDSWRETWSGYRRHMSETHTRNVPSRHKADDLAAAFRRRIATIEQQPKATSWRERTRRAEVLSRLRRWEARYRQAAETGDGPDWDCPF